MVPWVHTSLHPKQHADRLALFAQRTVECPITLQWAVTFHLNCPFSLGDWVPHLTHGYVFSMDRWAL